MPSPYRRFRSRNTSQRNEPIKPVPPESRRRFPRSFSQGSGNAAANVITTGSSTLGADNAEVLAAQAALSNFTACLEAVQNGGTSQALTALSYYNGSAMHALYQANEALGSAIDQLYAKLQEQAENPMKMGAVQGQYGQFNSAGTILGTLQYNTAVYDYQKDVGGFPANLLGSLFGVKEVEPFA